MNETYTNRFEAGGFQVPLAQGRWKLLASGGFRDETAIGMAYFLTQIEQGELVGITRILAADSLTRPGAGFLLQPFWQSSYPGNIETFAEVCTPHGSFSYWRIFNYFAGIWKDYADPSVTMTDLDRAAAQFFVTNQIVFSQDYLTVQFARAETWGLLQADYLFAPGKEIRSRPVSYAKESDWQPENLKRFPEKRALIDQLCKWGTGFWPEFKAAFAANE